ncbi:hypothetical protein MHZ95_13950 [Sporosarcina sp. ACRSM]|uniref:hypothetical protein n=1 Tax=Sporosarcina sp. ACRSM TaxID=2918216 RepID=UPI001EF4F139|nr:hypothetical protein [Sporosarcina sp. ACRSM]MCG7336367.1 hypothetical protein [Sporosarcina sp. ACRSM]
MNEEGYSWPEAILTLSVIMMVFYTLLPLATAMTIRLHLNKLEMYAAETALQGAISFHAYGLIEGSRQFEEVDYQWVIEGQAVCVSYLVNEEKKMKCVQ